MKVIILVQKKNKCHSSLSCSFSAKPPGNIRHHSEHWSREKPTLAPAHSWTPLLVARELQMTSSSWCWWSRMSPAAALPDLRASTASSELRTNPAPGHRSNLLSHPPFSALTAPSRGWSCMCCFLISQVHMDNVVIGHERTKSSAFATQAWGL